jgi:CDP-diacylglycerol---serine O-phosphatidyltransferase
MGRISNSVANLVTLGNALFGFLSIVATLNGEYADAALMLFFALIFDGMDGRVARFLNVTSDFGVQLDSLADIISFGVAPAVLMYKTILYSSGTLGLIAAAAIILAGIVRLARFNILKGLGYFLGLPIPVVGVFLAAVVYTNTAISAKNLVVLMLLLAYLMISRIRYPNFKQNVRSKNIVLFLLGLAIVIALVFVTRPDKVILALFLYYIIAGPVLELKSRING